MASLTATIETKLTRQCTLAVEVGSLEIDVADTQRSLAADQQLPPSSPKVVTASHRRVGLEKARHVNLAHLARHTLFSLSVNPGMWLVACVRDVSVKLSCDSHGTLCTS